MSESESIQVKFQLKLGDRTLEAEGRIPKASLRVADILPVLRGVNDSIIASAVEDAAVEGRAVSCRAGCGACCRQLVPVSEAEALSLLEWIATLPKDQQERIRQSFNEAVAALDEKGILDRLRAAGENPDKESIRKLGLDYFFAGVPCPFLQKDESCGIYPIRPMKCREYLVTSPAANCSTPGPDNIEMVGLPLTVSRMLFRFGVTEGPAKWLPLILLFERENSLRESPQKPGPDLLRDLLEALVAQGQERAEDPA